MTQMSLPCNLSSPQMDMAHRKLLYVKQLRVNMTWPLSDITFHFAEKTLDRDRYQSPEEAMAFGLVDEIVERRPEPPPNT